MNPEDVIAVQGLAYKEERFQVSGQACFWDKEQLDNWSKSEGDVCLVAEHNGEIIGFVLSQYHQPTGKATIENLFVRSGYRKQGIGRELFIECSLTLKSNGATYQCGMVEPGNESMLSIIKRARFDEGKTFVWVDRV